MASDSSSFSLIRSPAYRYSDKQRLLYFAHVIMAALHSRCGHYIFALWLLSSIFYFFPRLILAVADWMSAIDAHMVWP